MTSEDFIKTSLIVKESNKIRLRDFPEARELKETEFSNTGKLGVVRVWVNSSVADSTQRKKVLDEIKDKLIKSLSSGDIEEYYYDFLVKLREFIR